MIFSSPSLAPFAAIPSPKKQVVQILFWCHFSWIFFYFPCVVSISSGVRRRMRKHGSTARNHFSFFGSNIAGILLMGRGRFKNGIQLGSMISQTHIQRGQQTGFFAGEKYQAEFPKGETGGGTFRSLLNNLLMLNTKNIPFLPDSTYSNYTYLAQNSIDSVHIPIISVSPGHCLDRCRPL